MPILKGPAFAIQMALHSRSSAGLGSPPAAALSRKARSPHWPAAAAIFSALCWGSAIVMSKAALEELPPFFLLTVQLMASVAFLLVIVVCKKSTWRQDRIGRGWLAGLWEPGLSYSLGIFGLSLTTASNASLIGSAEPFFVVLLASLLLRERIGWEFLAMLGFTILGGILLAWPSLEEISLHKVWQGDVLIFAGTWAAAFYVISSRRFVQDCHPVTLAASQQITGLGLVSILYLSLYLAKSGLAWPGQVSVRLIAFAALSGIIQYALAFWFYLLALREMPASRAGFFLLFIPFFGILGGVICLGESLLAIQGLGAICLLGSAFAVTFRLGRELHRP